MPEEKKPHFPDLIFSFYSLAFLYFLLCWIWCKNEQGTQLKKFRGHWLTAYGTCTIFGVLPGIVAIFEGKNSLNPSLNQKICIQLLWYVIYVSVGAITFSYAALHDSDNEEYKISSSKRCLAPWLVFLLNILILAAEFFFCVEYNNETLLLVTMCFAPLYVMSSVQIARIYSGNIVRGPVITVGEKKGLIYDCERRIECHICTNPFDSAYRIPRILKECGHTVCEQCAVKLAEKNERKHLTCPFCQTVTLVKGPIDQCLPRNFTVMEELNEKKSAISEV
uniref:RING-type domain-containing protein n=1 Tax=Caenorhabditis tropicalis TaxID=1561998 RepID=A0A1I7UN75_9PELO